MSQGYNKVIMIGNLTKDPVVRNTPNGKTVCEFGLAVNEKWGGETRTCFIDVDVWGKSGEACAHYLSKGVPVLIEGNLRFDTWEKDNQRRTKHSISAFNVQFLGDSKPAERNEPEPKEPDQPKSSDDDDLPF